MGTKNKGLNEYTTVSAYSCFLQCDASNWDNMDGSSMGYTNSNSVLLTEPRGYESKYYVCTAYCHVFFAINSISDLH